MEHTSFGLREVKLAAGSETMTFSGYGAVFGNVDSYGDVIAPGAFAETLSQAKSANQWPAMLMQHGGYGMGADDMTPIGIWTEMEEDSIGLKVSGKLADTPRAREAYALLKMDPRPAIDGLSIGYIAKTWEARSKPDEPRRKLTKIDLLEVSLVTFPANRSARVNDVKGFDPYVLRSLEAALKSELDLSNAAAVRAVAIMKKHLREGGDAPDTSAPDEAAAAELADLIRRNINTLKQR